MGNSNTDRSKELRRKCAKARRAELHNLSAVLLNDAEWHELNAIRAWFGKDKAATQNDTIKRLIKQAYNALPASAKGLNQINMELKNGLE